MILTSDIFQGFQATREPEPGDTQIQVPNVLMPVLELGRHLEGFFASSVASPWPSAQIFETTALFSFSNFAAGAVAATTTLQAALAAGQWRLDFFFSLYIATAAVNTVYRSQLAMGFDPTLATETGALELLDASSIIPNLRVRGSVRVASKRTLYLGTITPALGAGPTYYSVSAVLATRVQ